eukprot:1347883-Amorphochlora_amoeboformis.AAC.1
MSTYELDSYVYVRRLYKSVMSLAFNTTYWKFHGLPASLTLNCKRADHALTSDASKFERLVLDHLSNVHLCFWSGSPRKSHQ